MVISFRIVVPTMHLKLSWTKRKTVSRLRLTRLIKCIYNTLIKVNDCFARIHYKHYGFIMVSHLTVTTHIILHLTGITFYHGCYISFIQVKPDLLVIFETFFIRWKNDVRYVEQKVWLNSIFILLSISFQRRIPWILWTPSCVLHSTRVYYFFIVFSNTCWTKYVCDKPALKFLSSAFELLITETIFIGICRIVLVLSIWAQ